MSDEGSVQEITEQLVDEVGSPAVEEEVDEDAELLADDEDDGGEDDVEAGSEKAIEEKIQNLKKKLKIKVNGKELEEELDFNDDERLTRALQKEKAFDHTSQELAQLKKEVGSLIETLRTNPTSVLKDLGLDIDDMAEKHIQAKIDELSKSPEQLEQEALKKELADLKKERETLAKEKETATKERMRNEHAAQIESDIIGELKNAKTLLSIEDPEVVGDIARAMYRMMKNGNPEVTVKDVIPVVEKRYLGKLQKRLELMDDDAIEQALGKPVFERLRKKRLAAKKNVKTVTAKQIAQSTGEIGKKADDSPKQKISYSDFFSKT